MHSSLPPAYLDHIHRTRVPHGLRRRIGPSTFLSLYRPFASAKLSLSGRR